MKTTAADLRVMRTVWIACKAKDATRVYVDMRVHLMNTALTMRFVTEGYVSLVAGQTLIVLAILHAYPASVSTRAQNLRHAALMRYAQQKIINQYAHVQNR